MYMCVFLPFFLAKITNRSKSHRALNIVVDICRALRDKTTRREITRPKHLRSWRTPFGETKEIVFFP